MCLLSHFHSFPVAQRSVTINEGDKSVAECIVAKNRHGQTDKVQLGWIGEYTLFRGLDFRRDDE